MHINAQIPTKLQPPTLSSDILQREQLVKRLSNGRYRKLTLISAPAGYGKSVLAGIWQKACDCPVAWLSLDKNDNELGVFLRYVISVMQTILPETYKDTATLLNGLDLPPVDTLTLSLVNETAVIPQPILLILDDYHLIHNPDIHQLIDSLIQYQSPHLHLVLVTRQDPPLDIVSLRAKNEVTEIRLTELRFNETETEQYLNQQLGDTIPSEMVHELFQRTEGWPVGLRLAVLALHNQVELSHLMGTFQGTDQYIMSYLFNEVLSQQPQHVETFLLYTSLLDRFCAPLCDALLQPEIHDQQTTSLEILERLCLENLFLIPLDHQNQWFRYHHLFQDLLQHQLSLAMSETDIHQLHVRASSWLAQQGYIEEALDHAFLAADIDRATQIIAQERYRLMNETKWQKLQQLLRRFPQDVIEYTPDLLMTEAWLLYHHAQYTKLAVILDRLTQLIEETAVSSINKNHLLGEINALQSLLSYFTMDIDGTRSQAENALKQTASELWIVRVFARMTLAGAQQMVGDLHGAYATLLHNFDAESEQDNLFKATVLVTSCYIEGIAADLKSVQQNATQAITFCQDGCSSEMLGNAHYQSGRAAYLQNDLSTAAQHFAFVQKRPYATYGDAFAHSSCGLALIHQAQGKEQEARDVVETALSFLLVRGNTNLLMLMKAFQADLALQQGNLALAMQWAAQFESPPPLLPMPHLYAFHFTLVKIWLAENTPASRQKATDLLAEIQAFLEAIHNTIFQIDALAQQAIIYYTDGDQTKAVKVLNKALKLALPGNIIRPFINLGQPIAPLLEKLSTNEPELTAFKAQILQAIAPLIKPVETVPDGNHRNQSLMEPLTDREMDILTLLAQRRTKREIGQKLHISPHTVHTHVKHIYTKLDVNNRRQAAKRAQELGLVTSK